MAAPPDGPSLAAMPIPASIGIRSLGRLPRYVAQLERWREQGVTRISCTDLGDRLGHDPSMIRKDLAAAGAQGRPRAGYDLEGLLATLTSFLGRDRTDEAFLVGAGPLGRGLAGHLAEGGAGLRVVGVFDPEPRSGDRVGDLPVLEMAALPGLVARMHVRTAVLAVDPQRTAAVARDLSAAGITALWVVGPGIVDAGPGILVEQVDVLASLRRLRERMDDARPRREPRPDRTPWPRRR